MKPLIKIRIKYFQRHICSFLLVYILLPVVTFMFFLVDMFNYTTKDHSYNSEFLFKNSFKNLTSILKKAILISDNIKDRVELQKFIYKETNINITTYSSESDISNKNPNVLTVTKIDNKYSFIFPILDKEDKEKNYNSFLEYQSLISKFLIFQKTKTEPNKNINLIYSSKPNGLTLENDSVNESVVAVVVVIFGFLLSFQ